MPEPYKGWVGALFADLTSALKRDLLGDEPRIFYDMKDLQPNYELERLLEAASQSRAFLAISSPAYHKRKWTADELRAFSESRDDWRDHLFIIAAEPTDAKKIPLLPEFSGRHVRIFHERSSDPGLPKMALKPGTDEFCRNVLALSSAIAAKIRPEGQTSDSSMTRRQAPRFLAPNTDEPIGVASPVPPKRTVLICQATDDLQAQVDLLNSALLQLPGVRVLPEGDFPQGGSEFQAAFRRDLEQADFVVQLLSAARGRAPADLPEGYLRFQAQAAERSSARLLQWRQSNLTVAEVADSGQRDLLMMPTVQASTFETFRKTVIDAVMEPPQTDSPPSDSDLPTVFVHADTADLDAAIQCGATLSDRFLAFPPLEEPENSASLQRNYAKQVMEADAVVLIRGKAGRGWASTQLMGIVKIRSANRRPLAGAVLHGPPDGKGPRPIAFVKGFQELDCTASDGQSWTFDHVGVALRSGGKG
ncbi:hypothetical protein CAP39_04945 [Sphingomonas sp. IBVSS1]|nr:hypothetical protein CAP39_04945 [Sphingomonas sp. IBVSS1]